MKLALPILASLLTLPCLAQTTPTAHFRAAEKVWLAHRPDGLTDHDDSPAAIEAMNAMRRIAAEVATVTLTKRPATTAAQLQRVLSTLPSDATDNHTSVLQLQPGLFAIAFDDAPSATFFIVHTEPSSPPRVWTIDSPGPQPIDTHHYLNAWLTSRSGDRCKDTSVHDVRDTCGPLGASIGLLPSDAHGSPRFYINAAYMKDAGILTGMQTSIWSWHNGHAELIWIDYYIGDPGEEPTDISIDFHNGLLRMDQRDSFKTFYTNNSDSARHMRHTVRITPTGIEDLGIRSLDPELDLVDSLFDRIARNQPSSRLASPQVIQQLRPKILQRKNATDKTADLGMIEDRSIHGHPGSASLCLNIDNLGGYTFTLQRQKDGSTRITGISGKGDPTMPCNGTAPLENVPGTATQTKVN